MQMFRHLWEMWKSKNAYDTYNIRKYIKYPKYNTRYNILWLKIHLRSFYLFTFIYNNMNLHKISAYLLLLDRLLIIELQLLST